MVLDALWGAFDGCRVSEGFNTGAGGRRYLYVFGKLTPAADAISYVWKLSDTFGITDLAGNPLAGCVAADAGVTNAMPVEVTDVPEDRPRRGVRLELGVHGSSRDGRVSSKSLPVSGSFLKRLKVFLRASKCPMLPCFSMRFRR